MWGASPIPVALSVVCHVSSVSTITTRNNQAIKSIFGANFHHVPGFCLLGTGGSPNISHKIMAQKLSFTFSTSFLKQPAGGASSYAKRLLKPRPV